MAKNKDNKEEEDAAESNDKGLLGETNESKKADKEKELKESSDKGDLPGWNDPDKDQSKKGWKDAEKGFNPKPNQDLPEKEKKDRPESTPYSPEETDAGIKEEDPKDALKVGSFTGEKSAKGKVGQDLARSEKGDQAKISQVERDAARERGTVAVEDEELLADVITEGLRLDTAKEQVKRHGLASYVTPEDEEEIPAIEKAGVKKWEDIHDGETREEARTRKAKEEKELEEKEKNSKIPLKDWKGNKASKGGSKGSKSQQSGSSPDQQHAEYDPTVPVEVAAYSILQFTDKDLYVVQADDHYLAGPDKYGGYQLVDSFNAAATFANEQYAREAVTNHQNQGEGIVVIPVEQETPPAPEV